MNNVNVKQKLKTKVTFQNNQFEISSIIVNNRFGISYETMIFADNDLKEPFDYYEERYNSEREMLERHNEMAFLFNNGKALEIIL